MVDARNRNNQYANIALRAAKNVFTSGMNMDADLVNMPQSAYRMATDFRLTVTNDGTMGSLENIRGNTLLVNSFLGTIVGSVVVDNDVIILTHSNDANNISRIYRITFTGETLSACTLLYSDESYGTEDKLNLSVNYPVKMVSRKESTDIEKIYWVDGNNYLRFANIAKPLTTDGEPYVFGVNDYFSAKKFGIVANVKFVVPLMTSITSGGLNVGMVQYSYQLYNKNGAETAFAQPTGLYHIVSTSENLASSYGYKGNPAEAESGKAYNFTLDLPDDSYEYDYIRVVSIHYTTYGQLPTISIIVEKPIGTNGVVPFSDTGGGYIGTYTPEQFSMLSHLYKAGDIESSKNYLFLANITEDFFDIGTYDARAYRFSADRTHFQAETCTIVSWSATSVVISTTHVTNFSVGDWPLIQLPGYTTDGLRNFRITNVNNAANQFTFNIAGRGLQQRGGTVEIKDYVHTNARIVESNGDMYFIHASGGYTKVDSAYNFIEHNVNWATIPLTADAINTFNDSSLDATRTLTDTYNSLTNGVLGGIGANIYYTFSTSYLYPDDGSSTWKIETTTRAYNPEGTASLGYSGYYTPNITAGYKTYELDETYRFGIVFTDRYGRDSVVNWIGDIRMPSISNLSPYFANYDGTGATGGYGNYIKTIAPIFTVSTYPTDAVSYRIVRVERTSGDKSIVCSGLLRPTMYRDRAGEDYSGRQPLHLYEGDDIAPGTWVKYDMHEFISPEISFYKSLQTLGDDYIQVHDVEHTKENKPFIRNLITGADNYYGPLHANIKYRRVSPNANGRVNLTILEGKIVQIMESVESEQFTNLNFHGYYSNTLASDQEDGYKGTSLIIRTASTDVYGVPVAGNNYTYMYAKYGVYRRNIQQAQYGGNTFSDRSNNEYIAASKPVTIPDDRESSVVQASFGDMFVHFHEHMALYHTGNSADNVFLNLMFPVSTSINLALRYDDRLSSTYNGTSTSYGYRDLREEGNLEKTLSEMYLYNTVYSQENNIKKYYPLPEGEEFEATEYFNTRIIVSEKKINGESSDSWLQFLTNNFIDVDANYGSITNILTYNNNLLYWQPKGFGSVDVNPRSLITDNSGASLVVGTGDVLTRFDYISTLTGNSNRFGLINAIKGVYWYDSINKTINRFNGESIERLSKLKGVQSYLNDNAYTTTITGYDVKNDELLFTLGDTATLCYNEMVDAFTAFYSFVPVRYITVGGKLLTTETNTDLFIHASTSAYGSFYGNATPYTSNLTVLVNELIDYAKTFDVLNYQSYSYNNNVLNYLDTFDRATFYTSYQNSYSVTLVPGTNVERKIGMWSMFIARNLVNPAPEDNPDIFDIANRNPNKPYKERLRDTHMYINLEYDNSNNYRLVLPYLKTKYRISHR